MDERAVGRFGASPYLVRGETRCLARDLIVERYGVAEGKGPEVTTAMFRPSKSGVDHERAGSANRVFDRIFGHAVVMMATHPTVLNPLALQGELSTEFL